MNISWEGGQRKTLLHIPLLGSSLNLSLQALPVSHMHWQRKRKGTEAEGCKELVQHGAHSFPSAPAWQTELPMEKQEQALG